MKAVLVYWSPVTRVVVPDNATDNDIILAASDNFHEKLLHEYGENIEKVIDDIECPYDPEFDKE
mgnify:FL=1